ncbi:MAG: hypothetical protein ACXVI5_08200 [Halobacteriota archaeon]
MKKHVVSLLVMLIALAYATTGVVSAANASATTTSTVCPATAAAQCTSPATSECCNPRPSSCPVIKTEGSSTPAVVSCVAVTKCCEYKPVVMKAAPKTPVMSTPSWVPQSAEKIVHEYQNPSTTNGNKVSQSDTAKQNSSVIVVDTGHIDGSNQTHPQNNTVTINNANIAAANDNSAATSVNVDTNKSAPLTSSP